MKHLPALLTTLLLFNSTHSVADTTHEHPKTQINTSLFALANFTDDSPQYLQLELSRPLSSADYLGLEFITWRYAAPLGIPYGSSFGDQNENYPGQVRDIGLGLTLKHFFNQTVFAKVHATPLLQTYTDPEGNFIERGFQQFTAARLGYQWTWADDRFFIEPSVAVTAWPIRSNVPEHFAEQDARWPGYFLLEPGLNIGVNF